MLTAIRSKSAASVRHAPVWIGLFAVAAMSWYWLVLMDQHMAPMASGDAQKAMAAQSGDGGLFLASVAMWAIMMTAMMLPTVVPSMAIFSQLAARRNAANSNRTTAMYVLGYSACWVLFALPAAALQSGLAGSSLLNAVAQSTNTWMSAGILIAAGLYQFSPVKTACLAKCRSPLAYLMAKWRDGAGGALVLGIKHGGYCVGCCWALMALMFVVGAMNLVWMGAITVLVLSEKVMPPAWQINRIMGAAFVIAGIWLAARAVAGG